MLNLDRLDAARLLLEQATEGWAQEADPSDPIGLRFAINLFTALLRQGEENQARRIFDLHLHALWSTPRLEIDPAMRELIADLDGVLQQHPQRAEVLKGI
ncbi:hypothetical protein [Variovorax sp. GT1P44]|uniref:hypothetical protein n=1 Tax=Variovorax sp. GT1P44 TaxID=3443742 RepID=UPI003F47C259